MTVSAHVAGLPVEELLLLAPAVVTAAAAIISHARAVLATRRA